MMKAPKVRARDLKPGDVITSFLGHEYTISAVTPKLIHFIDHSQSTRTATPAKVTRWLSDPGILLNGRRPNGDVTA